MRDRNVPILNFRKILLHISKLNSAQCKEKFIRNTMVAVEKMAFFINAMQRHLLDLFDQIEKCLQQKVV